MCLSAESCAGLLSIYAFVACLRRERAIELCVEDWNDFPWLLRVSYVFPYVVIGTVLGRGLDHHVNRTNSLSRKAGEQSAESKAARVFLRNG
jgi:hypothetical protein